MQCTKDETMIISITMSEFYFVFPEFFESFCGFLNQKWAQEFRLGELFDFIGEQVAFLNNFNFSLKTVHCLFVLLADGIRNHKIRLVCVISKHYWLVS